MSKSGSRYGRRSNWFKIHCLLQEKANYAGQQPSFRSPVTPTLQDGSLPFVASQMREPVIGLDAPGGGIPPDVSSGIAAATLSVSSFSQSPSINANCGFGFTDLSRLAPSYSTSPTLNQVERKYQEELLNRPPRPTNLPFPIGTNYREHVLHLLQRSQSYEPLPQTQDYDAPDDLRVTDGLRAKSLLDWDRRLSRKRDSDVHSEKKSPSSPKDGNLDSPRRPKSESPRMYLDRKCIEGTNQEILTHLNNGEKNIIGKSDVLTPTTKEGQIIQEKSGLPDPKLQDSIMTDEERLSFLKSANSMANNMRSSRNDDHNNRLSSTLRFPSSRDDLLYNPVNNNLFSFPPYPPLWPSMIPFTPFSKFYSPFCAPRVPPPVGFDPLKPPSPFPLFNTLDQRFHLPILPKEDPEARKRLLDDILQIQRHNKSPTERNPISSPPSAAAPAMSLISLPHEPRIPSNEGEPERAPVPPGPPVNQPIDLSVRRKRKMDKSEIIYKPGDELEEMDSELERDQKEGRDERHEEPNTEQVNHIESSVELKLSQPDQMELKVTEIDPTLAHHSFVEVPLKLIKLEASNETLAA